MLQNFPPPATKCFSCLATKKTSELNIVKQVECVDQTLTKYKMSEKVNQDATAAAHSLPMVKHVLPVIEEGADPSSSITYQGVQVLKLPQSKDSLTRLIWRNVKAICQCQGERYGSFVDDEFESSKETKEADETAHSIAKVLNSKVWMPAKEEVNREYLSIQLKALEKLFDSLDLFTR